MHKTCLTIFLVIALSFFSLERSQAQWVQTKGPYGGIVSCFALSGTNLFTGTEAGVFLSTDNGSHWTAVDSGLTNTNVSALTVIGTNLFAGTDGGIFLSVNNGTSWTAVNSGLTWPTVWSFAVTLNASGDTTIFAGVLESFVPSIME